MRTHLNTSLAANVRIDLLRSSDISVTGGNLAFVPMGRAEAVESTEVSSDRSAAPGRPILYRMALMGFLGLNWTETEPTEPEKLEE